MLSYFVWSWIRLCVCLVAFFAAGLVGCSVETAEAPPQFDSARAFAILRKQCDFGPRPPGSPAHLQTRDYLYGELKKHADAVTLQEFKHSRNGQSLAMWNIIAHFGDQTRPGVLLCAHWDTRPTADQELDPADRKKPILGANDGASGVAVLVELARLFNQKPPAVPVTLVLFDGEDLGPTAKDMFLGSRHFAASLGDKSKYRYGILLDMVGDKELEIYREGNSEAAAEPIVRKVWTTAFSLGYRQFRNAVKYTVSDDHVPLIEAGVPCIDVIDFDYAWWHTLDDTVDKCSPESLKVVGNTIARVIYSEKADQ